MTCDLMILGYFFEYGNLPLTSVDLSIAAGMKATTGWWIDGAWHITFQHDPFAVQGGIRNRYRR